MYHSDLRKEIAYLHAQLDYKRRKLAEALRDNVPMQSLDKLYAEIKTVEEKLQHCFEEANTQFEN
jgi:uncharacterized membrane protein